MLTISSACGMWGNPKLERPAVSVRSHAQLSRLVCQEKAHEVRAIHIYCMFHV